MSAFVLDADIWTLACENHVPTRARIAAVPLTDRLMVSAVTCEEAVGGWLSFIRKARTPDQLAFGNEKLLESIRSLASFELVPFSLPAIVEFKRLVGLKLNVRHNDLPPGRLSSPATFGTSAAFQA